MLTVFDWGHRSTVPYLLNTTGTLPYFLYVKSASDEVSTSNVTSLYQGTLWRNDPPSLSISELVAVYSFGSSSEYDLSIFMNHINKWRCLSFSQQVWSQTAQVSKYRFIVQYFFKAFTYIICCKDAGISGTKTFFIIVDYFYFWGWYECFQHNLSSCRKE